MKSLKNLQNFDKGKRHDDENKNKTFKIYNKFKKS